MLSTKWVKYAENMAIKSKAYRRFNNAIKTDATRSNYSYSINRFMRFLHEDKVISNIEDYESLLTFDTDEITDRLEDFVSELNLAIKPSGIRSMLAAPELFFEMNRKIWHKKLVRKSINKDDAEISGDSPITTSEVSDMLKIAKHPRDIALIHFFASTGSRPAAIFDPVLRMKHLVYMPNPTNFSRDHNWCYAVKIYDESKEGYWGFLTPEATKALEKYHTWRKYIRHEKFTEETPVFATFAKHAKQPFLSDNSIKEIFRSLIIRSALQRIKKGNRYDKALVYMFRKRFNTILKLDNEINSNIAEKLMAHKKGLDGVYLKPTRDECFKEFIKAIHELTVNPAERQKVEIAKVREENTKLEEANQKLRDREESITQLEKDMAAIQEKQIRHETDMQRQKKELQEKIDSVTKK